MLAQFQSFYPNGNIISELVQIFQGKYIVRVSLQIEGVTRATAMAGADTVEAAEDQARNRAFMVLGISNTEENNVLNESGVSAVVSGQWSLSSNTEISPSPVMPKNSKPDNQNYNQDLAVNFSETTTREEQLPTSVPDLEMVSSSQPEPESEPLSEITASNITPFISPSYSPLEDVGSPSSLGKRNKKSEPVNLSDVIAQTDVQIERLGWTKEQGREYLKKTYGKLGRSLLSEEELLDFLNYLKSQPDPIAGF